MRSTVSDEKVVVFSTCKHPFRSSCRDADKIETSSGLRQQYAADDCEQTNLNSASPICSQCHFGDGYWPTWDSKGNRWILNGIPCPHWAPGLHHIQLYVERVSPTAYRYNTLVFDDHAYGLNQTWTANDTIWPDMIGIQYQLDQDPSGTPLREWVDNVTLTMW